MGSHELPTLPATPSYRDVVGTIGAGAGFAGTPSVRPGTVADIAAVTLEAAINGIERAKDDEGVIHSSYLLTQLPRAARSDHFLIAISTLGLTESKPASITVSAPATEAYELVDLVSSFTLAIDRHLRRTHSRTDIGELAQQAAAESLVALCRPRSTTLFGSSLETVCDSLKQFSTQSGFARLSQDFFARLSRRFLLYHLGRELSNHVGQGRRFRSIDEHNQFLRDLDAHCVVCSGIVKKFAHQWYGKANWEGGIMPHKVRAFTAHALDKMAMALRYKGGGHEE
jgi:hypothetical protein